MQRFDQRIFIHVYTGLLIPHDLQSQVHQLSQATEATQLASTASLTAVKIILLADVIGLASFLKRLRATASPRAHWLSL